MRKVLIVSPHFPPMNAPDHQRVRMSLPHLREFGWDATVLAVRLQSIEGATADSHLAETIPADVNVVRVAALPIKITRRFGVGNLALRVLPFLWRAGNRVLATGTFDLVYFSTTQFPTMILGPVWKRRFGIPYVIDLQDPWLHYYYMETGTPPPGGKAKHGLSRRLAHLLEPRVMRNVAQVICVSPAYVEMLMRQYPCLTQSQFEVLPIGVAEEDFQILPSLAVKQTVFDPADGNLHWVYVGAAGLMMRPALRLLFSALKQARLREPEKWNHVRLHFIGTSYAPSGRGEKNVVPIAEECGVSDLIEERTDRALYFEALQVLVESDGILVIGSDSPSYSPSKLYPCMLARRPMLSILHEKSPAVQILRRCRAGEIVTFVPDKLDDKTGAKMASALDTLRRECENGIVPQIDWNHYQQFTAREMTRRQCAVFDKVSS